MVGSIITLAIVCILRIIAETLLPKFAFLANYVQYINYGIYGAAIIFAFFVVLKVINAILTVGKRNGK